MKKNDPAYQAYVDILSRELVPAMGCTEPIAIAYCAAKARSVLGALPERILVEASGNMIKNVKSVVVPNTNGQKGVKAAAAIGAFGGDEAAVLEVIAHISNGVKEKLPEYILSLIHIFLSHKIQFYSAIDTDYITHPADTLHLFSCIGQFTCLPQRCV